MNDSPYRAAILDLDGVITQTAHLHAQAWKRMFDAYLEQRSQRDGTPYEAFDIENDYRPYVDGKPRYEGVRSFLQSRGIELPMGSPEDAPDRETICGLGNRKNKFFHDLLESKGATPFEDAVEQIQTWQQTGIRMAVVSSSRNCMAILKSAGLQDHFEAKVDGTDLKRLGLKGKPAPDMFLKAAQLLGCSPGDSIVVEDAVAGVEAGRAGSFSFVIGVARNGNADALRDHGADVVVSDLRRIDEAIR